jgi:cytochrome c551/c552
MPQWKAFAQAMRQNASSTDALFRQRAQSVTNMSALDNMKSYAQIARAYADSTQALAEAFEPLYVALNDQQRHTIDALFHSEAAKNAATQPAKP